MIATLEETERSAEEGTAAEAGRPSLTLLEGLRAIPPRVARGHAVIPLRYEGRRLIAGARDPRGLRTLDLLRRLGHADASVEAISAERFAQVMSSWYGPNGDVAEFVAGLPRAAGEAIESSSAPRFLELTLKAAFAEGASDIHLEPDPRFPRVRFRVDGVLGDRVAPPPWLAGRVVGRIKALAGLALGDCLFAQDGGFDFPTAAGPASVRVSILPCDRGECVVLRLLAVEDRVPSLAGLGVPEETRRRLAAAAAAPEGLIVFAGPTGSGKSTTLHALLDTIDADRRNVVSIEEPVEIRSRRLRQVAVRRDSGLDFAGALRSVLRQDPDVILVGETRDPETAQMVVQAALAGHLVLTTVHASSALKVFDRFAQLGADRGLLAEVTRLAVSQRLLRRLCPHCGGGSCFSCEGTGLKGRVGVHEVLPMNGALAALVRAGAPPWELAEAARENGFRPLQELALDLVRRGVTVPAEVARVLDVEGWPELGMKTATVGLDLRAAGRAVAVAVDARGTLLAWALVDSANGEDGDDVLGDRAALAKAALGKLAVRVRSLRILLGAEAAPVGFCAGEGPPGEREIAEALLAEGYEPAAEAAVAAVRASSAAGGSWLVTAGDGEALARLADRLLAEAGAEPAFVVDQLLVAARLDEGAAVVEYGEAGLLIAARPSRSPVLVRALPDLPDVEEAARECRATLDPSGPGLSVRLLGSRRGELARALAGSGLEILEEPLPAGGSQPLPAGLELAWRLALDTAAPALLSPSIERRGKSLAWARRATRAAIAAALGGLLLAAAGLWTTWSHRARHPQPAAAAGAPEVAQQVEQVRQLAALADRIEQRRTEAAGQTAPWPRLAETLAALARELPPETGWEKLAVSDGTLELRASATGSAPRQKLELLRSALARSPGLLNLSWEEPAAGKPGTRVRQVFKATLREPRG